MLPPDNARPGSGHPYWVKRTYATCYHADSGRPCVALERRNSDSDLPGSAGRDRCLRRCGHANQPVPGFLDRRPHDDEGNVAWPVWLYRRAYSVRALFDTSRFERSRDLAPRPAVPRITALALPEKLQLEPKRAPVIERVVDLAEVRRGKSLSRLGELRRVEEIDRLDTKLH